MDRGRDAVSLAHIVPDNFDTLVESMARVGLLPYIVCEGGAETPSGVRPLEMAFGFGLPRPGDVVRVGGVQSRLVSRVEHLPIDDCEATGAKITICLVVCHTAIR
jgi:hypothetical protein